MNQQIDNNEKSTSEQRLKKALDNYIGSLERLRGHVVDVIEITHDLSQEMGSLSSSVLIISLLCIVIGIILFGLMIL